MNCHEISCTQFNPCGVTGTRSCTVKDKITAFCWKGTHACDYGRYLEAQTYHDAVQTSTNSSHRLPSHSYAGACWNVRMVWANKRLCTEKSITAVCYSLFLYLPYMKKRCWSVLFIPIYKLHLLTSVGELAVETHTVDEIIRPLHCLCNCMNSAL
jgi:hypothetical protein